MSDGPASLAILAVVETIPAMEGQGRADESVALATYASGAPAFMASFRGSLLALRGCLVVSDDAGRMELLVFRAQDVEWDGETLTYGRQWHRLGDRIELDGGLMALRNLKDLSLPEAWAESVETFVVAPSDPVADRHALR